MLDHCLLVIATDNCYQKVKHNYKHEKCLDKPYEPDQVYIDIFKDRWLFFWYFFVFRHAQLSNSCSKGLENCFLKISKSLCFINFGINLHFKHDIANTEEKQKYYIRNYKRNELKNTRKNHLHQKSKFLINSNEK